MRIAVLTASEPIYHPEFFRRLLERRACDIAGIFLFPSLAKGRKRGPLGEFIRFSHSFGLLNAIRMGSRFAVAKCKDHLGIGRARGKFYSIEAVADHFGVPNQHCENVNAPEFLEHLRGLGVDLLLSVSCPQIFKKPLIQLPRMGCLNLHGADLPKYRGLMPSFWMFLNGEPQGAMTLFYVAEGIDVGDVAGKRWFPIHPDETLDQYIRRSRIEGCQLVLDVLDQIEAGVTARTPMTGEGSYYSWPTREAYRKFRLAGRRMW
jgi:methionyl-tRNA formyltransferase